MILTYEDVLNLKNSNLSNKDKLEKIIQYTTSMNYCIDPNNLIKLILEIFDLQQCNKIECYWYHNKKSIQENNCCLSTDCFYNCYESGFEEHYQEKKIYFFNELGMNEVK